MIKDSIEAGCAFILENPQFCSDDITATVRYLFGMEVYEIYHVQTKIRLGVVYADGTVVTEVA